MKNKRGFVLLLALMFMTVLTVLTGSLIYMATAEMKSVLPQSDDTNLAGLADAGIDKAQRAIADDYDGVAPAPGAATGVADLRGATSSPTNMQYIDALNAVISTGSATVSIFDSNYTNTRIVSVVPHIVASRQPGGSGATIRFDYTTNGAAYTTVLTQVLPNSATLVDYSGTAISGLTWAQIMSPNFRLRATRTAGNRNVNIDAMYLRVTCGIDTLKESWATGGYATFPISLSGGTIQSITITDEASKAHLNYASQSLLTNLLTNLGIASAATKAANIVTYRGASLTNPFDSVEEVQQVTGITAADYAAVKDYVTVYSYINPNVYRPTGPRAPININTASSSVLKSVFDSLGLGAGDAQSLANDIVTFRNSTPFTCFYSANAAVTTDFNDFVMGRAYLTTTERSIILDNCDASSLIPIRGYAGYNCTTTEFCYAGNAFYINTLARLGTRSFRVKTLRGNDSDPSRTSADRVRTFSTYSGDTTFSGWRKENFE